MRSDLVLITGGAGFIGSHLADGLLRSGYRIRILDDLSVGSRVNIPTGCEFIQGNILDEDLVERSLENVGSICHQAARVTIRGSVERFYEDAETNLMGTLRLLKSAAKKGVRRFVYASSMAIYADSSEPLPVSENHPAVPASPYGIAKLAAEQYVLMTGSQLGLKPVVLRYFNTFGTRQAYTPYVGVITIFITQLCKKQGIAIYGDGEQRRDFVHVSDIVQANLLALQKEEATGEVFNVGTGRGTSVNELAALLKEELYPEAPIQYLPAREEELRNSIADISRARRILGYSPNTNLHAQIPEVIQYIRNLVPGNE